MRVLLLTAGTRGDVEPFVALAHAAVRRGHQVRLVLPLNHGVDTGDLDTRSLGVDYAGMVAGQGVSPLAALRTMNTTVRPLMRTLLVTAVHETLDFAPDVVVHHPKVLSAAYAAARLQVPRVVAEITPSLTPTRFFPAPGVVDVDLGPLNRATYLAAAASARLFAAELTAAAAVAGVDPREVNPADATLVPVSPSLLGRPADWPAYVHVTGAWALHRDQPVDPVVEEFINRGPFLYAGFGSMAAGDPGRRAATIVAAARERSLGVLLATGWGGLAVPDSLRGDDLLTVASAPHDEVLPRAYAAIHHGGAGTVHAVARAGTVSIVVPFFADQPFWGRRLHARRLAPAPIPQQRLTLRRLRRALDAVQQYRPAVRAVRDQLRTEPGVSAAVDLLETLGRSWGGTTTARQTDPTHPQSPHPQTTHTGSPR